MKPDRAGVFASSSPIHATRSLFTLGAPLVPPADAALVGVLEVVLAPVWVWLAFNEVPSTATLVGGALVLAAVVGQVTRELIQQMAPNYRGAV
jgi:drug/metabolite transporter (DMT)-like permease